MHISEADTRAKFIDPEIQKAGWENFVIREHYFTDGRKLVGGKRGRRLFVDYLLRYKNTNLAIIEAKRLDKHPTEGLQQAINYAQKLNVKFVFATNGESVYEFNMQTGKGKYIENFPTPEEIYKCTFSNLTSEKEELLSVPFYLTGDKQPRYYQENAVNRAIEAITNNEKRILLTLATGTGKTFIAFQLVYKLIKKRWNLDKADRTPKILILADRNVLADQAINTFNDPFEKDLVKIDGSEIKARNGKVPTNAHIFFAIYQAISEKENIGGYYKQYPKDFFDLVIIDECHRGSANEEGSWRAILDHFESAIHLGLTATPKRKDNIDTYDYFKKPVYQYSLKEGINDGFLSPYKVKKIRTNIDSYIYTDDDLVLIGDIDKKRIYKKKDYNKSIIISKQVDLIAQAIIANIRPMDKSIIFCVDQPHALNMRDAINKYKKISDPNYCVRITSDEGKDGRELLELFQNNDRDIPVILTSSQMLTTGVDARNVRNIILVREINSMVEFKQIVGRGTRLFEGKDFFTIIDFSEEATDKFYDPQWDGLSEEKEVVQTPCGDPNEGKIKDGSEGDLNEDENREKTQKPKKIVVELSNGRKLKVIDVEIRYIDESGIPLTTNQFLEKLIGIIPNLYNSEKQLRDLWSKPETREGLLHKLAELGIAEEQLKTLKELLEAENSDIFDVLMHISYSNDIITRKQRAEKAQDNEPFFEIYQNLKARDFLKFVLDRYEKDGIKELKRDKLADLVELNKLGTTKDAAKVFGGINELIEAFYKLQEQLYSA
ncbi:DEAD/DEAH box helicase [Labilibaculum sp. A4]|uniref:EcoAI/FtnUII family type I restriction enzme subunit R n=1 Tax=Labilibaculum euxinus TaxID=2686357 RepID=UPI000F619505|nr:type I restriction endonuclease subunit R [Labilibaculum euxinus]MDQ1769368.1 DEAD/DEAH box helicase family protein [Labilibaculum euxinus]MWN74894.1 DEAD/DEAH box helicase [Labilibaculum euxinus]